MVAGKVRQIHYHGSGAIPPAIWYSDPISRPPAPPPAPLLHPLAAVAAELEALPATALRELAGTRSRRRSKRELVGLLVAC
jgi:hypothetical protein